MRLHALGRLTPFFALAALVGCDNGDPNVPDADSLVGHYALIRYDGGPLPNGGVTGGALNLRIEETIPVYDIEWTRNGTRIGGEGLYSVTGNTIVFFGTLGGEAFDHSGIVDGDQVTLSVNDGTFTFERD